MNNKTAKNLIVLSLALVLGSFFGVYSAQAQDDKLILETSKKCDIQYTGDSCVAELKLTNNAGEILDGTASLLINYQGVCSNNRLKNFDGEGITAQFSINNVDWLNFSGWKNGTTAVSGFKIAKGEIQPKLRIETVPNLCPGEYTFNLELKGTFEEEEYIAPPVVIGGGGGGAAYTFNELNISNTGAEINAQASDTSIIVTWLTNKEATSRVIYDTIPHPDLSAALPPNYGYAFSTILDPTKVTGHSVTITGLTPGTTYYLRPLSSASPEKYGAELAIATTGVAPVESVMGVKINNNEPATPSAGVVQPEVLGVKILGQELTPTGFSNSEFIGLLAILVALIGSIVILRKRYQV